MKTILFQGDSITDGNRRRSVFDALGEGYVLDVAKVLGRTYTILNRGISGNKTSDLVKRWQKDTLDLRPDILFILIGINDIWHRFTYGVKIDASDFEKNLTYMIETTQKELPKCTMILLYPFVLKLGYYAKVWDDPLAKQHAILDRLAKTYRLPFIPLQTLFDEAAKKTPAAILVPDGVHPSAVGNQLIADAILRLLKSL